MRLNNKLLGLMVGGTMIGLLAMSGIGRAQPVPPDTFFSPLPLEEGNSLKGEPGNVEVILGNACNSAKGKKGDCTSKKSKNSVSTFNDQIRIRGIFTNFDPIVEGTTCNSAEEADDNFLNSGGSTFFIGVGNGSVGALCVPSNLTGIGFTLVWTPSSKKSNVAVPLNGTAIWADSNGQGGTANAEGTMTLLYTGLGDCGTWAMDLTFSNVSAASLGPDKSMVNIQMDYGSEPPDGATSFGCLVTPLDVEKNSFD